MKNLYIFLLMIPLSLFSQENIARISILSSPDNIQVRLNSVLIGKTPIENFSVKPGNHHLEALSNAPGNWYNTNIYKKITLKAGQDTTIFLRFSRPVKINSIPFDARLLHNDREIGVTPITLPFEENQGKEFRIEKAGYQTFKFMLDNPNSKMYILQKIDLTSSDDESSSFAYSILHKNIKSKFFLLTGTVITHWMAFYFKNMADNNYQKYLGTGNPALMDKYWENTQKYDRFSDISLGVSYAFLGGLIYTVLFK